MGQISGGDDRALLHNKGINYKNIKCSAGFLLEVQQVLFMSLGKARNDAHKKN